MINEIKLAGKTVTSTEELVVVFNDHFSTTGPRFAESIPNDNDVNFRDFIAQRRYSYGSSFKPVCVALVYTLLIKLSASIATEMDKILAKFLQVAAPAIAPSLTGFFFKHVH